MSDGGFHGPPAGGRRHIHLDPIGGVAGDMFVAALLDAEPALEADCIAAAETVARAPCRLLRHHDAVLSGSRFVVRAEGGGASRPDHGHHHGHDHDHRHEQEPGHDHGHGHAHHRHPHAAWSDIRARLAAAALAEPVRRHAIGIFAVLAEAEAQVHGIEPEAVTFHEVGAVDSIADIVAAASLIAAQSGPAGEATWSTAPLPLGGGRVRTAHGILPVPAPATALLLRGFPVLDDGVAGERVTPTGAAILRYLNAHAAAPPGARRLRHTGIGFGTRTLPGLPNVLRALVSESAPAAAATHDRRDLSVIGFEVDDQTPEDLATALERLRALPGVMDAMQWPGYGKKGRIAAHVQVLVTPDALEATVDQCFRETTTLGLRVQHVDGRVLRRGAHEIAVAGRTLRVKRAERPGGVTAKVESDDVAQAGDHAARQRLRGAGERPA